MLRVQLGSGGREKGRGIFVMHSVGSALDFPFSVPPLSPSSCIMLLRFDDSLLFFLLLYSHVIFRFIGALSSYIFSHQLGLPGTNKYPEKEIGGSKGVSLLQPPAYNNHVRSATLWHRTRDIHCCPGPGRAGLGWEARRLPARSGGSRSGRKGRGKGIMGGSGFDIIRSATYTHHIRRKSFGTGRCCP